MVVLTISEPYCSPQWSRRLWDIDHRPSLDSNRHLCKLTPYIRLPARDSARFHSLWIFIIAEIRKNSEWRRSRRDLRYNAVQGLVRPTNPTGWLLRNAHA